ncbi:C-C motif chemokine 19 isoform X1 [Bubalus bubalis]|uniref:C-C motif chemokine 19 isoform X1 n=1 Tax=Bubalus bubalis TaxID=89462 RepID=UPI00042CC9B5|nr:C-C motif chemokine 19 isoform X1 [Bubalus bubalis]
MAFQTASLLAVSLLILWVSPGSLYLDTNPTLALGGANDAEDCCLSVTQRPIPVFLVRAYRYLLLKDGCRLPAVVFTTQRGHELCAPPDQPWVGRIIRRLKKNSARRSVPAVTL